MNKPTYLFTDESGLHWCSVPAFAETHGVDLRKCPRSICILVESALRACAAGSMSLAEAAKLLAWTPKASGKGEFRFPIGRVIMQDAAGLPVLLDLSALADWRMNGSRIILDVPATLVIDHSVQVDHHGSREAFEKNISLEFQRNEERFSFLKWAATAFENLEIVPPGNGIVHQVHLERIAKVVDRRDGWTFIDTVIGTDSHSTMINGLGVLGWGVGGIEAEATLLGDLQCIPIPEIIGVELRGQVPRGATSADVALGLTRYLRSQHVVGSFIEFVGPGVSGLTVPDRATIANMAPEYGATTALFPADTETLRYLHQTGREAEHVDRIQLHLTRQGLFGAANSHLIEFSRRLSFDLSEVAPTVAGPSRPEQTFPLPKIKDSLPLSSNGNPIATRLALASITSCTHTANPRAMIEAGLLARKAIDKGLKTTHGIKTSFAAGSRMVPKYLDAMGLMKPLERLGFHNVAFGCATCVGNSGALDRTASEDDVALAAVLSGNRNFESRIHQNIELNYLTSPALVVAFALAGRIDIDMSAEPIGHDMAGGAVMLSDIWATEDEIRTALQELEVQFGKLSGHDISIPAAWKNLAAATALSPSSTSTYLLKPPFFDLPIGSLLLPLRGARPLLVLGDSVTTDHISPVGTISKDHDAGLYLMSQGVQPIDFNSYAARRGNHEVMVRATYSNPRLRNLLVMEQGPLTRHMPSGETESIHSVAQRYKEDDCAMVVIAGNGYGTGSARDWAAKGMRLLGIRAVIAAGFERIHRGNLVRLGILPIELEQPLDLHAIGAAMDILVDIEIDPRSGTKSPVMLTLHVDGTARTLRAILRADTTSELEYLHAGSLYQHALAMRRKSGAEGEEAFNRHPGV